ncbi:ABC transporter ATP-binding protein [Nocardia goodfellowii]|uniref:Simple sugar transport system ATP-binding protein n=1 Tax=Nocardia goodfellowii TaxID=882446 RepID=A0ABS4QK46_9NOCA|nr:ABC transporter ATP-binding protein [Nocardia goodfellowii]MBP2192079.1 simple sugar transport system ATP-binding protein [Nocardia goodfellowii]
MTAILELTGVGKTYGAVRALADVDVTVRAGEVHCVLGENGAGKSTLCNVVFGGATLDAGRMRLFGQPYRPQRPADALRHGIAMVHQHFSLVPDLTVAENLALGEGSWMRVPRRALAARVEALGARFGLRVDLNARAGRLSVGDRQQVEIVKCLLRDPRLVLLDEPTAVLGPAEIAALLTTCRRIAESGRAVVLVTHKLGEIEKVGDRATVLRGGRVSGAGPLAEFTRDALVELMIGRPAASLNPALILGVGATSPPADGAHPPEIDHSSPAVVSSDGHSGGPDHDSAVAPPSGERPAGVDHGSPAVTPTDGPGIAPAPRVDLADNVVHVTGLRLIRPQGGAALDGLDLVLRPGTITGIAGVEGNGQSELVAVLSGARRPDAGTFELDGTDLTHATPAARTAAGLGVIPEDRHHEGCIPAMSIADNLFLGRLSDFRRRGLLDRKALHAAAAQVIAGHDIIASGPGAPVGTLSGGNQQKVVVARELALNSLRFLVAAHPTRGLDLGAVDSVLARLRAAAESGVAVLIVSHEVPELLTVCDRVLVAYRGRLHGPVDPADPSASEQIAHLMLGTAS